MKKLIKKLLRESLLEGDYNMGGCNLYAVALHRKMGLPIFTIRGYFLEDPDEPYDEMWNSYDYEDGHVVVQLPNGNYLDSDNIELTKEKLIKQTFGWVPKIKKVEFIEISEKDACNLYYGSDEQDEIKPEDDNEINDIIKTIK